MMEGTLTDPTLYAQRERICDMGFLRTLYKRPDGKIGYRCPAEPPEDYIRKGGAAEDTVGRVCLCNALGASAGFPQIREDGYIEKPLITSGNDLVNLKRLIPVGQDHFSAREVVDYLLGAAQPA